MAGDVRIGVSGWRYPPWRGVFYPEGLVQRRELEYAAQKLSAIEINGTFYSLQRPERFRGWHAQTPAGFRFAVKGSRYITHMLKLKNAGAPLANFFAQGVLELREKLGPILWQFPPNFHFHEEKLDAFLDALPRRTSEAAEIARSHDERIRFEPSVKIDRDRQLRYAVEVRHESFEDAAFIRLLRRHRVALVIAETAGKWMLAEDVTAGFVYLRLHGSQVLYQSGYTDDELAAWAERIQAWRCGREPAHARTISEKPCRKQSQRDVWVFFDNTDIKLRAPFDAMRLREMLNV